MLKIKNQFTFLLLSLLYCFIPLKLCSQNYPDKIYTLKGDSISCEITLINDSNIFYNHIRKKSILSDYIALYKVKNYSWNSKDKKAETIPLKTKYSYDSLNRWNIGIRVAQNYNYFYSHSEGSFSFYKKKQNFFIGLQYSIITKEISSPNVFESIPQPWGGRFGYRYLTDSPFQKTNIFLQIQFGIYQLRQVETQLGPFTSVKNKVIVENTAEIGFNHKLVKHINLFYGIGFGSTNGFFLILDQFIPNTFVGLEYKFR